ncbi:rod shape-determining protein MreC [Paenibacillus albicereus]|uniref:Cell shape-determining protein MreC n=1 Tax=Paenibacillus albicereus TaxID=2726185 RepID=A0A6H2GZS4_9BACL|nr:rod shape-determining protein MreC [Paenibacillus albicereus]QJC52941.1 rod shape-determining protein MreC [Paenibacillus albicereus]
MFKHLRNRRLFVLMVSFILFIAVIGFSISSKAGLTAPEKFLRDTTGYVQQWFYKPAGYIAGLFQAVGDLRKVYEENDRLRMTAAAYARDKVEYNAIQQENERLQEKLKFTEEQKKIYDYTYLIAQVVAVSPDAYNRTMTINLGAREGIRERMAVISEKGMIGYVSKVSELTSTVMPITSLNSEESGISATVLGKQNQSFGILSGYNSETQRILMTKIAADDPIKKDDTVITSGLGNVFPRGMVIGTVESTQDSDIGLTRVASIKLSADFDHLSEVFVVQTSGMAQ